MEYPINLNLSQTLQLIAVLLTGLVAGLLYGYECSVVKGLGALQDLAYLQAFKSINTSIQNPLFFASFMGSLLVLPVVTWAVYRQHDWPTFYLLLTAMLLYVIGVFGITMFGNVPLNNLLATFDIGTATKTDVATMRQSFEKSWNTYHTIRTIAAVLSFTLTILALFKQKN